MGVNATTCRRQAIYIYWYPSIRPYLGNVAKLIRQRRISLNPFPGRRDAGEIQAAAQTAPAGSAVRLLSKAKEPYNPRQKCPVIKGKRLSKKKRRKNSPCMRVKVFLFAREGREVPNVLGGDGVDDEKRP